MRRLASRARSTSPDTSRVLGFIVPMPLSTRDWRRRVCRSAARMAESNERLPVPDQEKRKERDPASARHFGQVVKRPATSAGRAACAGAAEVIGYVTGASRLDWTPIKIHRYASKKETPMAWKTPKIVELPVGLEINMYACAARK